ncbi:hypothetical protein PC116_g16549 [Phytophthora cactorum]|nr:hypothetical protein PC114_g13749 [Phytophthora cactorum]KAG3011201.1 hypothetical protein PC119_g13293 [Phytophthora cactorum]KAG4055216.1 hypothetical protein PC123_g9674 [Phytophthora cactorum]KAG4235300.1 hypothetical protein PC116_g16549 [Phytophthora cactorum]
MHASNPVDRPLLQEVLGSSSKGSLLAYQMMEMLKVTFAKMSVLEVIRCDVHVLLRLVDYES